MSRKIRLLSLTALLVGTASVATADPPYLRLFEGSWVVKAFGNERTGGTGESEFYTAIGIPLGIQCNPNQPRCAFESTPTDGSGDFSVFGGLNPEVRFCAPWSNWGGGGATARPAKGETLTTGGSAHRRIPPLYRNPALFTPSGAPNTAACYATSTDGKGGPGPVQKGSPIHGNIVGLEDNRYTGAFRFLAALPDGTVYGWWSGIRGARVGERGPRAAFETSPYTYSYTYATLRNGAGSFATGAGPGNFSLSHKQGDQTLARVHVTQGSQRFGGTMRMLGALTSKVCYYRNGGCSLNAGMDWLYTAIGTSANTSGGVVTQGHQITGTEMWSNTALGQASTVQVVGSRFPWTTGAVTVTAMGPGSHQTVHYAQGYEIPGNGRRFQLVSPSVTHWIRPGASYDTAGIGILRIKWLADGVPEPHATMMLAAGIAFLAVAYRARGRRG